MKLKSLLTSVALFSSLTATASILPPNDLHLQDRPGMVENMTEEEFVEIIERVETFYAPIVASHGGELVVNKRWQDSTVNAYAQRSGKQWLVTMFGGLARRPEVTQDGFMLVVCHELGHHLAGFPFSRAWAANEGQSDFFATQSCARNIWANDVEINASFRDTVHPTAKDSCDAIYSETAEQNLCYRTAMGGFSLANLLGALRNKSDISFDTPDTNVVSSTFSAHPNAQCRLDTYLNGALCTVQFNDDLIPGVKFSGWFGNKKKAEKESLEYSCSQFDPAYVLSQRPKCWFKQTIDDTQN